MSASYQVRAPQDIERIAELEEENTFLKRQLAMENDGQQVLSLASRFNLTLTPAAILAALVAAQGRAVSKTAPILLLDANGTDHISPQVVDVHVCRIRKAIGFASIETIWGRGYRVAADFLAGLAQ